MLISKAEDTIDDLVLLKKVLLSITTHIQAQLMQKEDYLNKRSKDIEECLGILKEENDWIEKMSSQLIITMNG